MIDTQFLQYANKAINFIAEAIEAGDQECLIEVDFNDDLLSLVTIYGTYVINKQSVIQEIWLSSPISGPHHFAKKGDSWVAKNGNDLFEILSEELKINIKNIGGQ